MKLRTVSLSVAIIGLAVSVAAQQPAEDPVALGFAFQASSAGAGAPAIDVIGALPFEFGKPVLDAPYTADAVTEMTQVLADGNRIEHRVTANVARDSRGRVRRDQPLAALGPLMPKGDTRIVSISDPDAGVHYSLDAQRKVAIRTRQSEMPPPPPPPGSHSYIERKTEVVSVLKDGPAMSPNVAFTLALGDTPPETQTEQLGVQQIEGVRAEGSRTVATIAAGAIGNERPIEIVSERWYSQELQLVVMSRHADPRFGETVYRLTNIVRAEPSAELFQVPAGYSIEEGSRVRAVAPLKRKPQ
jgi:hypothetical protein